MIGKRRSSSFFNWFWKWPILHQCQKPWRKNHIETTRFILLWSCQNLLVKIENQTRKTPEHSATLIDTDIFDNDDPFQVQNTETLTFYQATRIQRNIPLHNPFTDYIHPIQSNQTVANQPIRSNDQTFMINTKTTTASTISGLCWFRIILLIPSQQVVPTVTHFKQILFQPPLQFIFKRQTNQFSKTCFFLNQRKILSGTDLFSCFWREKTCNWSTGNACNCQRHFNLLHWHMITKTNLYEIWSNMKLDFLHKKKIVILF